MSYWNKCKVCGCSLDPGEGQLCEDCLEEMDELRSLVQKKDTAGEKDRPVLIAV